MANGRDEAIARAVKLLRLAESANPHEAALAAARAQEILDRYEIDRAALEIAGAEAPEPDEPILDFGKKGAFLDDEKSGRYPRWRLSLASAIATANACQVYLQHSGYTRGAGAWRTTSQHRLSIVGRAGDVEKVRYLFAYLGHEVERLTDRDGAGCGKTWRNNYRLGVVDTLRTALQASAGRAADAARADVVGNSQALMIVERAIAKRAERRLAVDVWMKANLKLRNLGGSTSNYDGDARHAGRRAGQEIQLGGARGALGSGGNGTGLVRR